MEELNNITVIRSNDPTFPSPQFNFEELRRMGLLHIGELSGKIWTDHNVHDPGVTILEVLCYAMLDLGYRTKLPVQDILALDPAGALREDKFFTPAQILTSNPTTILDYRKMLIDIEGVENAWLEIPDEADTPALFIDDEAGQRGAIRVPLNGLYKVYLQLSREAPYCQNARTAKADRKAIIKEVKKRLLKHRNLCEDFIDIRILREEEIGIGADIELEQAADPEIVYVEAMKRLKAFFNPEVEFFTLQELLDKGRSIEEAFEGRPYSTESFGFIDTDQLEQITLPKEVHLSDIYSMLLAIEGVRSVRNIALNAFVSGKEHAMKAGIDCFGYVHHLTQDHAPAFCIDRSELKLFRDSSVFRLDPFRLDRLLKQTFGTQRSARFKDPALLDKPVPLGKYRADLSEYYSIQNEFPRVYGIGEDGLGEDVSDERKARALQLKAYLLFFDQLLAGYLSQLSNIRQLFSTTPDSLRPEESRHTYFTQGLDSITRINDLVRFYNDGTGQDESEGDVMAFPVRLEDYEAALEIVAEDPEEALVVPRMEIDAVKQREAVIEQLQREFQQGEDLLTEAKEEACGFFFLVKITSLSYGLLSKKRYKTRQEALLAAESVIFLGTLPQAYRMDNDLAAGQFLFEVVFKPADYLTFTSKLLEDEPTYLKRRNAFLDHLLARFSERFTDYSLLLYGNTAAEQAENKARLLSQYDELSRNRGKAFNYCEESWNTTNVSGLEKRVATLSAIPDYQRTALCNFEVGKRGLEYQFFIGGYRGDTLFVSHDKFYSAGTADTAARSFTAALQRASNYQTDDNPSESKYQILAGNDHQYASYPLAFTEPDRRDLVLLALSALFRAEAVDEDIFVHEYRWLLQLENLSGQVVKDAILEKTGPAQVDAYIKSIKKLPAAGGSEQDAKLEEISGPEALFLDVLGISTHFKASGPHYRWQLFNASGQVLLKSSTSFAALDAALLGFLTVVRNYKKDLKVHQAEQAAGFSVFLKNKKGERIAEGFYPDEDQSRAALAAINEYFEIEAGQAGYLQWDQQGYAWQLRDETGGMLLNGERYYREAGRARIAWLRLQNLAADRNNFHSESDKDSTFILLKDKKHTWIRSPRFPKKSEEATAWIDRVQAAFADESRVSFPERKDLTGFQVPGNGPKEGLLLVSFYLYADPEEAWRTLQELKGYAGRKNSYFITGDSGNLQFSFLLQQSKGDFTAYHPTTYETDQERNEKLNQVKKQLPKLQLPMETAEEFTYALTSVNGAILLQSTAVFSSEPEAAAAFRSGMKAAAKPGNLQEGRKQKGRGQVLELRSGDELLAVSPQEYSDKPQLKKLRSEVDQLLQAHQYRFSEKQIPFLFKFRFWWQAPSGRVEVLLESTDTFEGANPLEAEAKARQGYASLVQSIKQGNITFDKTESAFFRGSDQLGQRPTGTGEVELSDTEKAAIEKMLNYMGDFGDGASGGMEAHLTVSEFPQPETGTGDRAFVYRVYKKDLPSAFHPCQCQEETGHEDLIENLFTRGRYGFRYLELCLSGDITCEIDERYHYVLRDQSASFTPTGESRPEKIPYFISYQGYPTEAEARQAFQKEYLEVIMLASCQDNYCFEVEADLTGETGMETATGIPETGTAPCTGRIWAFEPPEEEGEEAGCTTNTTPLVYIPAKTLTHFEESGWSGVDTVVSRFASYPIRRMQVRDKEDPTAERFWKYYFRIVAEEVPGIPDACSTEWLGTYCYDTIRETREALRYFEYLLANAVNYRPLLDEDGMLQLRARGQCPDWEVLSSDTCSTDTSGETGASGSADPCCRYISIAETLIESNYHYEAREDAWGTSLMVSCEGWDKAQDACKAIDRYRDLCSKITDPQFTSAGGHQPIERHGSYYVQMGSGEFCLESTKGFDSEEEARRYSAEVRALLADRCHDRAYYHIQMGEGCRYHIAIGGYRDETVEGTELEACRSAQQANGDEAFCADLVGNNKKRGLERFLEIAGNEEAYIPFTAYEDGRLTFSFQVVDKGYHLARHPFQYNTPEARDASMQELCTCSDDHCSDLMPGVDSAESPCHYVIECVEKPETDTTDNESDTVPVEEESEDNFSVAMLRPAMRFSGSQIIWRSYETYCDCAGAEEATAEAATDFMYEVLAYAREARFYGRHDGQIYLSRRPFDPDQESAVNFEAAREAGAILAVAGDSTMDPKELMRIARNYPIIKEAGRFRFQLYCEDFHLHRVTDNAPCDICPPEDATGTGTGWETGTGGTEESGAVVWESVQDYDDAVTARCYYDHFCALLRDNSIDRTGEETCGPFSMQVIDPRAILATHPQRYFLKVERDRAIARTRAGIDLEGFHLVEHILLRPGRGGGDETGSENRDCLIPSNPDLSCELEYLRVEDDPCTPELETGTGYDPCREEVAFDKYIPGADPYSFWASVVLPNWPGRFRDHDFREAFQNLMRKETPAHIALNIVWVGPEALCRFESRYRQWLRELAGKDNCREGDPTCDLVRQLFRLHYCPEVTDTGHRPQLALANVSNMNICNLFHTGHSHAEDLTAERTTGNVAAMSLPEPSITSTPAVMVASASIEMPPPPDPRVTTRTLSPKAEEQKIVRPRGVEAPQPEPTAKPEQPKPAKQKAAPKSKPASAKKKATPKIPKETAKEKATPKGKAKPPKTTKAKTPPAEKAVDKPSKALTASEKRRLARRRVAGYRATVEAEADAQLKKTRVYEETIKFFEKAADVDAFTTTIDYNLQYGLRRKKTKAAKAPYVRLLQNVIWRFLDQQVNENPNSLQKAAILREVFGKLRDEKMDLKALATDWDAETLKEWTGAAVIDEYLKLMVKK